MGLFLVTDIGRVVQTGLPGCGSCMDCVEECPESALTIATETAGSILTLDPSLCSGVACRRCERVCPEKIFELNRFFIAPNGE
jgi:ferredoxin